MAVAQAQAESPGLSRFVLPILGLIGLGLCGAGILVLYDPQGGPNLLASIYDAIGNTSGATDLRNGQGDQVIAKLLLAVIALVVGVGGIWLLFLGVGGAVGLLQAKWRDRILPWVFVGPGPGAVGDLPGLPRGGDDPAQLPGRQGPAHARQLRGDGRARVHPDPAQQRHLADRRHRRERGPRTHLRLALRSRPARVAGQDDRLPAAGDLTRRRIGHLGLRLRVAAGRPAADRAPERGPGRPRWQAGPVAHDQPDQHLLRDRDPGLAPDRFRDGRLLGVDQGRAGRGPRGGPARWRLGAPALPRA